MSDSLHLYLNRVPPARDISSFLRHLGYQHDRTWLSEDGEEPDCQFWTWDHAPLSGSGFELLYFDSAFDDNVKFSKYECSAVLRGSLSISPTDRAMMDVTACLLLAKYPGVLSNLKKVDRKFTDLYLCGARSAFSS